MPPTKDKTQILDVFAVYTTIDEYGRLGNLVAISNDGAKANILAKDQGWYGGMGTIQERKVLRFSQNKYLLLDKDVDYPIEMNKLIEDKIEKLKRNALKKLTREEKKALDLL